MPTLSNPAHVSIANDLYNTTNRFEEDVTMGQASLTSHATQNPSSPRVGSWDSQGTNWDFSAVRSDSESSSRTLVGRDPDAMELNSVSIGSASTIGQSDSTNTLSRHAAACNLLERARTSLATHINSLGDLHLTISHRGAGDGEDEAQGEKTPSFNDSSTPAEHQHPHENSLEFDYHELHYQHLLRKHRYEEPAFRFSNNPRDLLHCAESFLWVLNDCIRGVRALPLLNPATAADMVSELQWMRDVAASISRYYRLRIYGWHPESPGDIGLSEWVYSWLSEAKRSVEVLQMVLLRNITRF